MSRDLSLGALSEVRMVQGLETTKSVLTALF